MKRQHLWLLLLLLILAGSIGYSILYSPRQERVAPAAVQPTRASKRQPGGEAPASGVRLRTDLLDEAPRRFAGVKRDLFYAAPEVLPVPVQVAVVASPQPLIPEVPPPPPPPTAQELMRIELGRFIFLGYLEKEGRKTIFLRAEGEPFVVKLGDRFGRDRQFLVESLAPTRMEIRAGDDPQLYPIILQEQGALSPMDAAGRIPVVVPPGGAAQAGAPQTTPPVMRDPRSRLTRPFGGQRPEEPIQEEPEVEAPQPPPVEPPGANDPTQLEGQNNGNEE